MRDHRLSLTVLCLFVGATALGAAGERSSQPDLDARVLAFLEQHKGSWHDMNVPEVDGRRLHNLIIEHGFRNGVEIGTSTGRSAIWIGWAMSKTGGKLTTIEIDESRYRTAVANFAEAGLSDFVDARRADAHRLVEELPGPFDFVFNDADKEWGINYFKALSPKLAVGGCYVTHNASMRQRGMAEFLRYVQALPNYTTTFDRSSPAGMSISCKNAPDPAP